MNWLDHGRTLREQGVEEQETLLLRRKFFYSDQNVDSRDPVQLNLLYVQAWRRFTWGREAGRGRSTVRGLLVPMHNICLLPCAPQARDDILNGSHPVSFDKACEFAGFQCQIQFGPHNEQKHKAGFLE